MKGIFLSVVFLFAVSCLSAQEEALFHGGAYAGISTSQLSGDQLSGFKKVGLYAGAFVNVHLTPKSLLQLEISYIQKGSRSVSKFYGLIYHVNLQYFEAPLLYKWQFSNRFGLEVGPAAGFLIKNTKIERDAYGVFPDDRPAFNRFDLSITGGVSIKIIEHLKTEIRFSQSVLPIRQHASGAVYRLNRGQYNSVIGLIFMVEF
jgi:hypothetical protein